jgi:hypothetical protein
MSGRFLELAAAITSRVFEFPEASHSSRGGGRRERETRRAVEQNSTNCPTDSKSLVTVPDIATGEREHTVEFRFDFVVADDVCVA